MKSLKMLTGLILTLLLVNSNFVFAVDPIADYSFDVDASDATGNFNGSLEGDAAIVDDAERGKVLGLTADGYVSVPPALAVGVDDFSIAAWVNFGGTNPWAGLMGIGMSAEKTHPYWDVHLKSDYTIRFYSSVDITWPSDGCAQLVINYELPALEWVHLALTFTKNSGAVVYANGVALELDDWTGDNDYSVSPGDTGADIFWIGRDSFNKETLTGTYIDDFQFFNTALTAEEVVAIFNGASGVEEEASLTSHFQLAQNYPNPFNPATRIDYSLEKDTRVELDVYDIQGNKVSSWVSGHQKAGAYRVVWDASKVSAGVYFYTMKANNSIESKKMILVK